MTLRLRRFFQSLSRFPVTEGTHTSVAPVVPYTRRRCPKVAEEGRRSPPVDGRQGPVVPPDRREGWVVYEVPGLTFQPVTPRWRSEGRTQTLTWHVEEGRVVTPTFVVPVSVRE